MTWHNRLELALEKRGKTYADLVRITGLTKPAVYAWKPHATKRTNMIDGDNAAVVCKALRISPMWLFHNEGDMEPDHVRLWPFEYVNQQDYTVLSTPAQRWVQSKMVSTLLEAQQLYGIEVQANN